MKLSILKLFLAMTLLSNALSYRLAAATMSISADVSTSAAIVQVGSTELEAFIDSVMIDQMKTNHVPGAVVSVVKDGKLIFEQGYGYSDYENAVLVDPERTLFRVGSIGKLFIWTAVMQLVEQGQLSLDA